MKILRGNAISGTATPSRKKKNVFTKMLAGKKNTRLDRKGLVCVLFDSTFTGMFTEHLVHTRCCDTLNQRGSSRVMEELGHLSHTSNPIKTLRLAA